MRTTKTALPLPSLPIYSQWPASDRTVRHGMSPADSLHVRDAFPDFLAGFAGDVDRITVADVVDSFMYRDRTQDAGKCRIVTAQRWQRPAAFEYLVGITNHRDWWWFGFDASQSDNALAAAAQIGNFANAGCFALPRSVSRDAVTRSQSSGKASPPIPAIA